MLNRKRSRPAPKKRLLLFVEELELRVVPTSFTAVLDPTLDQFGSQIPTIQSYGDGSQPTFGIFDTGASAVTFSADDSPSIPVQVAGGANASGIGGTVTGDVSQPGAIVADGLHIVSLSFDSSGNPYLNITPSPGAAVTPGIQAFIGSSNGSSDLPTITGTPILSPSANNPNGLAALITMQGVTYNFPGGLTITEPDIQFVAPGATPAITGSTTDPMFLALDNFGNSNYASPGNSITEAPSPMDSHVSLANAGEVLNNQHFLIDTGSQVTVISPAEAELLGLDLTNPEYTITVSGVGGDVTVPGFTLPILSVPTTDGGTLCFANVPVFVAQVAPGVDGLMGMNLFNSAYALTYDPYAAGPSSSSGGLFGVTFYIGTSQHGNQVDSTTAALVQEMGLSFVGAMSTPAVPELHTDKTPPTLSNSFGGTAGTNGWYESSAKETLNFSDADSGVASTTYTLDSGVAKTYTGPFTVTGDGTHTVVATGTDKAGNVTTQTITIQIDSTAPSLSGAYSGTLSSSGWYTKAGQETLTFNDTGSGVASVVYSLDGGAAQPYTGSFAITDGAHTLATTVTDKAGNVTTKTYTLQIDTTPPTVLSSYSGIAGTNGWYKTSGLETLLFSDSASGLASATYKLDNLAVTKYTKPFAITSVGAHVVVDTAVDKVGNTITQTFNIHLDFVPPVVTLNAVASVVKTSKPVFSGTRSTATGDSATVVIKIYSGTAAVGTPMQTGSVTVTGSTYSFTPNTLADGIYTVRTEQTDLAGNLGLSLARVFTVHTGTFVTIGSATTLVNATNQTSASIQGTAAVGDIVYLTITDGVHRIVVGGKVAAAGKWSFTGLNLSILNKGNITYTVTALDSLGFSAVALITGTKS